MTEEPFQIVSDKVSETDLKEEANKRAARAGYCSRAGEPLGRTKIMIQPPSEQYRRNYDRINWSK